MESFNDPQIAAIGEFRRFAPGGLPAARKIGKSQAFRQKDRFVTAPGSGTIGGG
jgi:hypothetical protein